MKNQAAFLVDKQRLELMDCDMPSVSDTDVLVEVAHVGICGSDMHIFEDPHYAVKDIKLHQSAELRAVQSLAAANV